MKTNRKIFLVFIMLSVFFTSRNIYAQEKKDSAATDLFDMDLSALMNMEVTTASKKAQKIDDAPAAVFVITKEDLRMYGVNTLTEALRLVPGMEIIQSNDAISEVSIRGFSRTGYNTSNKLLWLVDGRSLYFDILGGVRMESIPISIEDIERIEVVRGSGSALYGANAFLGIVNIISKKATEDGVHGYATAKYGNLNQMNTSANVTGKHDKIQYKLTVGYDNIDQEKGRFDGYSEIEIDSLKDYGYLEGTKGLSTNIYSNVAVQYNLKEKQSIRIAGGFSDNKSDHHYVLPGEIKANDFFGQLDYKDEKNSLRGFYNSTPSFDYRQQKFMNYSSNIVDPYLKAMGRDTITTHPEPYVDATTIDLEYQRNINFLDNLSAIVGASGRYNEMSAAVFATDGSRPRVFQNIYAIFSQVEYQPIEKLNIVLGGRFDNHSDVGNSINPRIAALYKISDKQTFRLGWGTATRNPHSFDTYMDVLYQAKRFQDIIPVIPFSPIYNLGFQTPNVIFNVQGNQDLKPEQISSFDLGYIFNVNSKFQIKIDAFYNEMKNPIEFGETTIKEAFAGQTSTLENIWKINPGFQSNLSALAALNGGVDPSIPNNMTKAEMQAQIAELRSVQANLTAMGMATDAAKIKALADGLTQVSSIYAYNLPKQYILPTVNSNEIYSSYGGEISFTYMPVNSLTLTGNYSYLKFTDNYNSYSIYKSTNNIASDTISEVIVGMRAPMHKANVGVKYNIKGFYMGTTFSFMSESKFAADNNRNGKYDTDDVNLFENKGMFTVDPRMNLNVNLGYQYKNFDVFVTGYNLIQDNYLQYYYASTVGGADPIHMRFMGGLRFKF